MDGSSELNDWSNVVIGAALTVHRKLGPGLLEHVYRSCLAHEVSKAGLKVESELMLALSYDELIIPAAYRLDLLVEGVIIIEIKAVEKVIPVHHAQLLTYLKLMNKPLGLFFNFNTTLLADGMKRMANRL
jgi:GxxExxY protein